MLKLLEKYCGQSPYKNFRWHLLYSCFVSTTDLQMRLSEQIFVCNNTLGPGIGYTHHQLVLGIGSGVPGIYQVPESESSKFARSLIRIKSGINQTQAQQAPSTLRGNFPYTVHLAVVGTRVGAPPRFLLW